MFFDFFIYKLLILDYILALCILLPVVLHNNNFQNIEKKIIKIFLWILVGLPVFFVFFYKFNIFYKNINLIFFFLLFNTALIILYYDAIKIITKKKKNIKYHRNNSFNFYYIAFYFIFLFFQIPVFL